MSGSKKKKSFRERKISMPENNDTVRAALEHRP
jgi:hypothetical protein